MSAGSHAAAPGGSKAGDLRRALGFWSATALVIGATIGSGIFRTPGSIAAVVHDPVIILALWLFFGIVCLCGALTLAELAAMIPRTGGTYVYLREAYGDGAAFVFGWLYLLVTIPSGVAAGSVFFGELLLNIFGAPVSAQSWGIPAIAISLIVLLSAINIAGVHFGAAVNNLFTLVKVAALLAVIAGAFLFFHGEVSRWWIAPEVSGEQDLAAAAKSVLYAYSGWIYVSLVAGELKAPGRIKAIILTGTGTIAILYVCANLAYLYLMPLTDMPGKIVGVDAMIRIAGPIGGVVMTACILASIFGGLNAVIMTKSRVAFAQGRDGLSFAFLGRAHPTRATPHISILIQGAGAIALVLALREPLHPLRLFDRLTAYFVLVEWLALVGAISAVFVLRRKMPDRPRPYRTPLYPFVPLVFILGTLGGLAAVIWSSCAKGDFSPLFGLGIMASGFPVYWVWRRTGSRRRPPGAGASSA